MAAQVPVLRDIRVVDFGHYIAGPLAGMLLADYGADVIKVESPSGPSFRTAANAVWNRGKRTIALDLKTEADRRIAFDLMRDADVVIENFRPGRMDSWGLGETQLRAVNPSLIYASMPGFSADDPRAKRQGWEGMIYAATDTFKPHVRYNAGGALRHVHPDDREGVPQITREHVASSYAALLACSCIVAALRVRERSGLGQRIEVPLFDAMLMAAGLGASMTVPPTPWEGFSLPPLDLQYECADGRWFHPVCEVLRHGEKFLAHMGRTDFIERGMAKYSLIREPEPYMELYNYLTEIFRTKTAAAWEELFVELELPGAMCRSLDEWLEHEALHQSNLLIEAEVGGRLAPQPNTPVLLSGAPRSRPQAPDGPDAHRAQILKELEDARTKARRRRPIAALQAPGAPLAGLKVLDLCIVLAGPVAGRTLAEFGADVIKIDDPTRGPNFLHDDTNRGKTSIFLDLRIPADLDRFWTLAEQADVVLQNYRTHTLDKYGITSKGIKARNPKAIWVAANAYGEVGPWSHLPGYEGTVQALTGMQHRRSNSAGMPCVWSFPVHDYATGYSAALGVLLALYERDRSGRVHDVEGALLRSASVLQSRAWAEALEGAPEEPPLILDDIFACDRGWVYVAIKDEPGFRAAYDVPPGVALHPFLAAFCAVRSKAEVVADLTRQGFAAHELAWMTDVMSDPANQARGVSRIRHNARGVPICYPAPASWMSLSPIEAGKVAQAPGSGAAQVWPPVAAQTSPSPSPVEA